MQGRCWHDTSNNIAAQQLAGSLPARAKFAVKSICRHHAACSGIPDTEHHRRAQGPAMCVSRVQHKAPHRRGNNGRHARHTAHRTQSPAQRCFQGSETGTTICAQMQLHKSPRTAGARRRGPRRHGASCAGAPGAERTAHRTASCPGSCARCSGRPAGGPRPQRSCTAPPVHRLASTLPHHR